MIIKYNHTSLCFKNVPFLQLLKQLSILSKLNKLLKFIIFKVKNL